MNADIRDIARHFTALAAEVPLRPIRSDRDYRKAVRTIDALLDAGGADESHALSDLVALVGEFVDEYEKRKGHVLTEATGVEALRPCMAWARSAPVIPGMRWSVMTRSGLRPWATREIASSAEPASLTL